ncbi:uncharacterized protein CIMG_13279 [Coccidioides immitis RS]|uniref:Uncharacterized protein n=1 Tax=Coccidioides immitis (strain RS) TaxID=246410 RepID=A0A0D8JU89_COCIM|nr:uncharacterized protein CIMG_13279 [Coccidioides immitis RS]KJF60857.1 hypothetical protein CIMG_13279 [Coccidioides immitis RS]
MAQLQPVTYEDIFFASALVAGRRFTLYWLVYYYYYYYYHHHHHHHQSQHANVESPPSSATWELLNGELIPHLKKRKGKKQKTKGKEHSYWVRLTSTSMDRGSKEQTSPNVNGLRVAKASRMCSVSHMRTNQGIPTFRRLDEQINRLPRYEDED